MVPPDKRITFGDDNSVSLIRMTPKAASRARVSDESLIGRKEIVGEHRGHQVE